MRGWRSARAKARARKAARYEASRAVFAPPVWPPSYTTPTQQSAFTYAPPPPYPPPEYPPAEYAAEPEYTPPPYTPAAFGPQVAPPPPPPPPVADADAEPEIEALLIDLSATQPVAPLVEATEEIPVAPEADEPAPVVGALELQTEFLRLFEVVTSMCDHVIEYIESDRAERRLMLETLTQLGRVITDGAAAAVAANAVRQIAAAEPVTEAPPMRERVIGGSMPAGPEPVIDLRGTDDLEPLSITDPEPEPLAATAGASAGPAAGVSTSWTKTEIAVEVRGRFGDRWVDGFEICEVMTTPQGPRYRLRRHRDGVVLPELFDATSIRHVETFDQLRADPFDADTEAPSAADTAPDEPTRVTLPRNYWSRS